MKQVSAKFGAAVSLTTLVFVAFSSFSIAEEETNSTFAMPSAILSQTNSGAIITILPPIGGGNTEPAPGNYTSPANGSFTVNALASENFYFDLWVISISDISEQGMLIGPGLNYNYTVANPLAIKCEQGYTYVL